jgi:hypothetical protein
VAVGITAIISGGVYLGSRAHPMILDWALGLIVIATACFVLIGLVTPVMSTLTGLGIIGTGLLRLAQPTGVLLDPKLSQILVLTMALAIVMLGPGAFSLDAHLFGRREIIIPPSSRSPRS